MKKALIVGLAMMSGAVQANVLCVVDGYTKATGTVVASYIRSQTACVTTNYASTAGGLTASTAAKILSGVGILIGAIALKDASNRSIAEEITKESHQVIDCSPNIGKQGDYPSRPGKMQIIVGKEKAIALYSSIMYTGHALDHTMALYLDEGVYKQRHWLSKATFDPLSTRLLNLVVNNQDMYSCKVAAEINIKDEE
jgi:hypothetical protein